MKKFIGMFITGLLFLFLGSVPAFGQHGHGGGAKSGGGNHGGGHAAAGPRGGGVERGGGERRGGEERGGVERGRPNEGERGRNFDAGFRGRYFGRGHGFRAGGERFGDGWRFNYGGFWWGYDAWPVGWGIDDPVYIDADGDVYYLYDPLFPGSRLQLNVVF